MNKKSVKSKLIKDELIAILKECNRSPLSGLPVKVLAKKLGSYPERINYHLAKLREEGKIQSMPSNSSKQPRKPLILYVKS